MMTRVNGQQALELLKGTTPGPWAHSRIGEMSWIDSLPRRGGHTVALAVEKPEDASLLAAAPALAETVAWLYGREPDELDAHHGEVFPKWHSYNGYLAVERPEPDAFISMFDGDYLLTPDDAEDLARALLSAAERARRG